MKWFNVRLTQMLFISIKKSSSIVCQISKKKSISEDVCRLSSLIVVLREVKDPVVEGSERTPKSRSLKMFGWDYGIEAML